jgi:hypothetical protein
MSEWIGELEYCSVEHFWVQMSFSSRSQLRQLMPELASEAARTRSCLDLWMREPEPDLHIVWDDVAVFSHSLFQLCIRALALIDTPVNQQTAAPEGFAAGTLMEELSRDWLSAPTVLAHKYMSGLRAVLLQLDVFLQWRPGIPLDAESMHRLAMFFQSVYLHLNSSLL